MIDDDTLPFIRQHTTQWVAARAGRVTTSTFALALGFWSEDFSLNHLNMPLRGRSSRDARDAAARDAVCTQTRPNNDSTDESINTSATRLKCLEAVAKYNAQLSAVAAASDFALPTAFPDELLLSLNPGGWAIAREHAIGAACGGAREVACALGKEQENAAVLAVLWAFPNSKVFETGSVALHGANVNLAASPDGVLVIPGFGFSNDATETVLAKAVDAGGGTWRDTNTSVGSAKKTKKKTAKKKPSRRKPSMTGDDAANFSPCDGAPRLATTEFENPKWCAAVPKNHVAVALEIKVASPFRWSTSGLKSFNNQAQYKVDQSSEGARDFVAPSHVPQLQLEAACLHVAGTLCVSYSPFSAGCNAGGSLRARYVPFDQTYMDTAVRVLRDNAGVAPDTSDGSLDPGSTYIDDKSPSGSRRDDDDAVFDSSSRRTRFDWLVRNTKRIANKSTHVCDLAPVPIPPGADDNPFLRA